jgi:hypothetical protein
MSVCLSAWFGSITAGRIWMKFCVNFFTLVYTLNRTSQFPTVRKTNMANERICEVESTVATFATGRTVMCEYRFSKIQNFNIAILYMM